MWIKVTFKVTSVELPCSSPDIFHITASAFLRQLLPYNAKHHPAIQERLLLESSTFGDALPLIFSLNQNLQISYNWWNSQSGKWELLAPVLFLNVHVSVLRHFLNKQACEKKPCGQTGSDEPQLTIMENPIGPLITQLGMGLSFVSQHLKAQYNIL